MSDPSTVIAAPHTYVVVPEHFGEIAREIEATGAVGRRTENEPRRITWEPIVSSPGGQQLGFELGSFTTVTLKCSGELVAEAGTGSGAALCPEGHDMLYPLMDSVSEWLPSGIRPTLRCPECGKCVPASECDVQPLYGNDPSARVHMNLVVSRLMIFAHDATIEYFDTPLHRRIKEILGVDHLQFAYLT